LILLLFFSVKIQEQNKQEFSIPAAAFFKPSTVQLLSLAFEGLLQVSCLVGKFKDDFFCFT
jgi:hypothetical protein